MSIQAFTSDKKSSWKANLPVLWLGVFLCCASYTMCIPFLPVYLLRELHVAQPDVNFWAGITFAVTFMGSAVMAPYWALWLTMSGRERWRFAPAMAWR